MLALFDGAVSFYGEDFSASSVDTVKNMVSCARVLRVPLFVAAAAPRLGAAKMSMVQVREAERLTSISMTANKLYAGRPVSGSSRQRNDCPAVAVYPRDRIRLQANRLIIQRAI